MNKCPKCEKEKSLQISYCVECGHGDLSSEELRSLNQEDLSFAITRPHGRSLVEDWMRSLELHEVGKSFPPSEGLYLISAGPEVKVSSVTVRRVTKFDKAIYETANEPIKFYEFKVGSYWSHLPEDFLETSSKIYICSYSRFKKFTPKFQKIIAAATLLVGVVYASLKAFHQI